MASASSQKESDAPSIPPDGSVQQSIAFEDASEESGLHSQRKDSISQSFTSEDSQTVILNHPSPLETPPQETLAKGDGTKTKSPNVPEDTSSPKEEPTKCWICFSDETEDTTTSSEWRSPCPCALKAHESCLLDWVADLKKSKGGELQRIRCPQCNGVIRLREPHSVIVDFGRILEAIGERSLNFVVGISLGGTILGALWFHGYATVHMILGAKDAEHLLGFDAPAGAIDNVFAFWMPVIPITLIGSRFPYSEGTLKRAYLLLPLLLLTSWARKGPAHYLQWPPRDNTILSCIPVIYMVYKQLYDDFMQPFKLKWDAERTGKSNGGQQDVAGAQDQNLPGLRMELGVQLEIEEEVLVEDAGDQPPNAQQQQAGDDGQAQNDEQAPDNNAPPLPNANVNADAPAGHLHEARLVVDVRKSMKAIAGSLLFPVFSFSMGNALSWFLPRTWLVPPGRYGKYPRGLLQSRFARTVIGGCLFIALKDALQLYTAYHSLQAYKQRRILDHKRPPQKSRGS